MKIFAAVMFNLLLLMGPLFGETAILPYRVVNPSEFFPESSGAEYSRILYLTATLKKKVLIATPESVEIDIQRLRLEPVITDEEVELLGRTRQFDYVLSGSLSRVKDRYISRTRLYAVRDRKVILETENASRDLFSLAVMDVNDAFSGYPAAEKKRVSREIDIAVLLDSSYSMKDDLKNVKQGISALFASLVDARGYSTRMHILPFSDRVSPERAVISAETPVSLRQGLSRVKALGKSGSEELAGSFRYALKNIRWRRDADRLMILITNSSAARSIQLEDQAYTAQRMKVPVFSVICGRVTDRGAHPVRRISEMTGGRTFTMTYHKSFIGASGRKGDLYLERGRLFYSPVHTGSWKDGLLKEDPLNPAYLRFDDKFQEMRNEIDSSGVNPDTMIAAYQKAALEPVLKENPLESNAVNLFESMVVKYTGGFIAEKEPVARVLLSDGRVSFWAGVYDRETAAFFSGKERDGYFFPLGIIVREDSRENYGLAFEPCITGIASADIPAAAKTDISRILANRDEHLSRGIASRSLWFVSVKVEAVEYAGVQRDFREP